MNLKSERAQALIGLGCVGVLALWALWAAQPSAPQPSDVPSGEFSAERAFRHVEALAQIPHPLGSPEHDVARGYVVDQFRDLGWNVEVDSTWIRKRRGRLLRYARLQNVVARRPSSASGPVVLFASHYDSVPTGPGAGDAATPVAAILESARALEREEIDVDLRVLITDGEEAGLLGAGAFARRHPWMREIDVVFNFEARGNHGIPWMFETGSQPGRWIELLAESVPRPFASSFSTAVYRQMPNDTDYSVFRRRSVPGLNFAMIGFHPAYHSMLDTPENLSLASLQHMGESVLGLARGVGASDWQEGADYEATFFNLLGSRFVHYPRWIDVLVLVVSVLGGFLWLARTRSRPWQALGRAAAVLAGVVAAVWGSWSILIKLFPDFVAAPNGAPYHQKWLVAGWVLISLAIALACARGIKSQSSALGAGLVLLAVLGLATAAFFAGGAYLFVWPLAAGVVGALASTWRPSYRWLWWTLAALPVPLLYAPLAREALLGLTPHGGWLVAALVTLGAAPLLVHLHQVKAGAKWTMALAAAGLVALLAAGAGAQPTAATPKPVRFAYVQDPDGTPMWVSRAKILDPWLEKAVAAGWTKRTVGDVGDYGVEHPSRGPQGPVWTASAPKLPTQPPSAEIVAQGRDDRGPWVDLQLGLSNAGAQLWISFETPPLAAQWLDYEDEPEDDGPIPAIMFLAPAKGEVVRLWLEDGGSLRGYVYEVRYGLPAFAPELPTTRIPSGSWVDFTTRLARRFEFDSVLTTPLSEEEVDSD